MEGLKVILALTLSFIGVASQARDGLVVGEICRVGEYCPPGRAPIYDRREVVLNSYYRDQSLDIARLVGIGGRDTIIDSVEVRVYTDSNAYGTLSLYADGRVVAQDNYPSVYTRLVPYPAIDFNYVRQALLSIRGKLYIERVVVNFHRQNYNPPNPYPPGGNQIVLTGYINRAFYAPARVELTNLVNLNSYRGYQISAVTVNGRSLHNIGTASLMINGTIEGRINLPSYTTGQTLYPRGAYIVGNNVNSVILLLEGTSEINTVQIRLTRF